MYSEDWTEIPAERHEGKVEAAASLDNENCKQFAQSTRRRLSDWTVEDVVQWASTTQLSPEVGSWLRKHEVSGAVLRTLDEVELTAMGLEPFGRRRQLLLLREELLAEDAAKEQKADPRTKLQSSKLVEQRRWNEEALEMPKKPLMESNKEMKEERSGPSLVPTPLRSRMKPSARAPVQELPPKLFEVPPQPDVHEPKDWSPKSASTELAPPSEATLAPTSRSVEAVLPDHPVQPHGALPPSCAPAVIEGIASHPRCAYLQSHRSQKLLPLGSPQCEGRSLAGRAINCRPGTVLQSPPPPLATLGPGSPCARRIASWMPARVQAETSASVKVIQPPSWAPAVIHSQNTSPCGSRLFLNNVLEAQAQAWASALAKVSQRGHTTVRAASQSRPSLRRIVGYSVTIRPRPPRPEQGR